MHVFAMTNLRILSLAVAASVGCTNPAPSAAKHTPSVSTAPPLPLTTAGALRTPETQEGPWYRLVECNAAYAPYSFAIENGFILSYGRYFKPSEGKLRDLPDAETAFGGDMVSAFGQYPDFWTQNVRAVRRTAVQPNALQQYHEKSAAEYLPKGTNMSNPTLFPAYENPMLVEGNLWVFEDAVGGPTKFIALDKAGNLLATKLPGKDMGAARTLAYFAKTSEVVGMSLEHGNKGGGLLFHRWSRLKPVSDLKAKLRKPWDGPWHRDNIPHTERTAGWDVDTEMLVGKDRVFVRQDQDVFVYSGEKLTKVKAASKIVGEFSWAVGANDELYIALANGTLVTETASGEIHEQALPEAGRPFADPQGHRWLVGRRSGALYTFVAGSFQPTPVKTKVPMKVVDLKLDDKGNALLAYAVPQAKASPDNSSSDNNSDKRWTELWSTARPKATYTCSDSDLVEHPTP
jgi:hypothetical protein